MKDFGHRVRELREAAGKSQRDIAENLDLERKSVMRMENESGYDPKLSVILALADYFGVTLEYLAGITDDKNRMTRVRIVKVTERKFFNEKWNKEKK